MDTLEQFNEEQAIVSHWLAMVGAQKRNPAHAEIKEIAKFWTAILTGKGVHDLKIQLRLKETTKQKALRKRVNNATTRYVGEKTKTTYREVDRCDGIKEVIDHDDPKALEEIRLREKCFYGEESVDKFNDDYILNYSGMDPNAFNLINIKPYDSNVEKPYCYPSIIKSKDLRDWKFTFNDLQYVAFQVNESKEVVVEHLWTKYNAYTLRKVKDVPQRSDTAKEIVLPTKPVLNLAIWSPNADADYQLDYTPKTLSLPEGMTGGKTKERHYVERFVHNLGFVPAKRLGWVKSFEHEHDVLESHYLPAKERFVELYQKKSSYDVHLAVHGIAKQITYLPSCNYTNENHQRCLSGKIDGKSCPKCKGTGKMPIHKSELDIVTIELPLDGSEATIIDASKLHQYVEIPKHIIEMHEQAADNAARDVALALFNTNVFKRAELTAATATEVIQNNKSIDNALYMYAAHRAAFKEFQLKSIAAYLDHSEGFEVSIKYPSSFKLETQDELYIRRKLAKDSGIGPHGLIYIDMDILAKQNADNPDRIAYVQAIQALRPYGNDTESERVALVALLPPQHRKRLSRLYFDDVLYELDSNNKTRDKWFKQDKAKIKKDFDAALDIVIDKYKTEEEAEPPAVPFGNVPPAVDPADELI